MSISSRITEMEEHIRNAYDKIEDLGIDTTNINKNINNISSVLENVWDEQPKVLGQGTDVVLKNTRKGKMKLDINGNTEQEQLSGKNLFDGEIELGSISPANGELQPSTTRTRSKNFLKVKPNTTYTMSVQTGQFRWIIGYTADKIGITDGNISGQASAISTFPASTEKTNTFTTTATTEYIKWYDTSSTDLTEKVQLEEGSTATSYEPYCRTEYQAQIHNFHRVLKM